MSQKITSAAHAAQKNVMCLTVCDFELRRPVDEAHAVKWPSLAGCGERMVFSELSSDPVATFCSFVVLVSKDTKVNTKLKNYGSFSFYCGIHCSHES